MPEQHLHAASADLIECRAAHASETIQSGSALGSVCIIVPTRNEARNIAPLIQRLQLAVAGTATHVLFVDDSSDTTPRVVQETAAAVGVDMRDGSAPFTVGLLHRVLEERVGGLGGAVQAGLAATDADIVVVMDGDLQHPPEVVPQLVSEVVARGADVAVASRYCAAASAEGLSSKFRGAVSSGATAAAHLLFPRTLSTVTDPMSGFFALRRSAVDPSTLRPRGFKILLEILVRTGSLRAVEVPYEFAVRAHGDSKASWREAMRYLRQLLGLRFATGGAIARFIRFGTVGASGILINLAALAGLLLVPVSFPIAGGEMIDAIIATQVAIAWNLLLAERWVFRGSGGNWARRLPPFFALNNATLFLQLPLAARLQAIAGVSYVVATALAVLTLSALRFVICDALLFGTRVPVRVSAPVSGHGLEDVEVIDLTRFDGLVSQTS